MNGSLATHSWLTSSLRTGVMPPPSPECPEGQAQNSGLRTLVAKHHVTLCLQAQGSPLRSEHFFLPYWAGQEAGQRPGLWLGPSSIKWKLQDQARNTSSLSLVRLEVSLEKHLFPHFLIKKNKFIKILYILGHLLGTFTSIILFYLTLTTLW